jgi:predicted chitinase
LPDDQQTSKFPVNIELSSKAARIGDTITITGSGFSATETYVVTFTKDIVGDITEGTNSFLKVIVPENAETGNISLTFSTQTEIVGSIEIVRSKPKNEIYVFHDSESKLARIDPETGSLTYIGNNINYGVNTRGAVYHSENNEYIGFENDFSSPHLIRISIENGAVIQTTIPNSYLTNGSDFSDLMINDNNEVYIFHDSESKLAKIDVETGDLTYIGSNINYGANTRGAVYHSGNNEYIGFERGFSFPHLIRISIENGAVIQTTIPNSYLTNGIDFSDIIIN